MRSFQLRVAEGATGVGEGAGAVASVGAACGFFGDAGVTFCSCVLDLLGGVLFFFGSHAQPEKAIAKSSKRARREDLWEFIEEQDGKFFRAMST